MYYKNAIKAIFFAFLNQNVNTDDEIELNLLHLIRRTSEYYVIDGEITMTIDVLNNALAT